MAYKGRNGAPPPFRHILTKKAKFALIVNGRLSTTTRDRPCELCCTVILNLAQNIWILDFHIVGEQQDFAHDFGGFGVFVDEWQKQPALVL